MAVTGFLLNNKHTFDIDTTPTATPTLARLAAGFTSFDVSFNEEVDQSHYLDGEGFASSTVTGGQIVVTLSGHRKFGDVGQDYVFGKQHLLGSDRESKLTWTLPSGAKFVGPCTIAVLEGPSGDAAAKGEISVEFHFNGKPTYTPPTP